MAIRQMISTNNNMRMRRNLIAGLSNSVWSVILGLAVVPFYLKYLGIEAYGLIGFFVAMQAMLQLLDMGMAPTLNREVARCSVSGKMHEARSLLHTLASIYWVLSGVIALSFFGLASAIADNWLQSETISQETMTMAIKLMGLVIACRWPVGLYHGALMGAQRLAVSSYINIIMLSLGSLGSIVILAFVSPTIEAFFVWQACVGLMYALTIRLAAWRIIGKEGGDKFDLERLKQIWRFSAGMTGIALTGIVCTQLDKLLLSKFLGLEEFAHYMLAIVVASGLYTIVTPLFNVMYPRFSTLVESGDTEKLTELYRLSIRFLASILFPVAAFLILFAEDLVFVWTGDAKIASSVAPVVVFLSLGTALHGVMYLPYALQLAFGKTNMILRNNIILVVALIPLVIYFCLSYGALGGGIAWFVLHILSAILVTWQVQRYLLKGEVKWFIVGITAPLVLTALIGGLGYYLMFGEEYSVYIKLISGGLLAFLASLLSIMLPSQLRHIALKAVGWRYLG